MSAARDIRAEALALPPEERAQLIEDLLGSFNPERRREIDAAWVKESLDRLEAYDRGEMESISWEESRRRIGRA